METRGTLAEWNADRRCLVVHGAAKVPFFKAAAARKFACPAEDVDIHEDKAIFNASELSFAEIATEGMEANVTELALTVSSSDPHREIALLAAARKARTP